LRLIITLTLCLFQCAVLAQSNQSDSLRQLFNSTSDPKRKIELHLDYINSLIRVDAVAALLEAEKLKSNKSLNPNQQAKLNYFLGEIYLSKGIYDSAKLYAQNVVEMAQDLNDDLLYSNSLITLGIINDYLGYYDRALSNYLKALTIKEKLEDSSGIADINNNIAILYNFQGEYEKAIDYFKQSLKTREKLNDERGIAGVYNNLGLMYMKLDNYGKALEYQNKSLELKKELGDLKGLASSYNNIGIIYFNQDLPERAIVFYEKALKVKKEIGFDADLASSYLNIGEAFMELRNFQKSEQNLQLALQEATKTNNKDDLRLIYQVLAKLMAKTSQYKAAYEYHQNYSALNDSIYNQESAERIAEMQARYELERKEKEIELLQKEKKIQQIQTENEVYNRNVFLIGFLIITVLVFAVIRAYRQVK